MRQKVRKLTCACHHEFCALCGDLLPSFGRFPYFHERGIQMSNYFRGVPAGANTPNHDSNSYPGTPDSDTVGSSGMPAKARSQRVKSIPMGRLCTPADIAHLLHILATPRANFITGQTIDVDRGSAI